MRARWVREVGLVTYSARRTLTSRTRRNPLTRQGPPGPPDTLCFEQLTPFTLRDATPRTRRPGTGARTGQSEQILLAMSIPRAVLRKNTPRRHPRRVHRRDRRAPTSPSSLTTTEAIHDRSARSTSLTSPCRRVDDPPCSRVTIRLANGWVRIRSLQWSRGAEAGTRILRNQVGRSCGMVNVGPTVDPIRHHLNHHQPLERRHSFEYHRHLTRPTPGRS